MPAIATAFWVPKRGNSDEEYEDAFAPKPDGTALRLPLRFAIADGATDTSFSKQWAQSLVTNAVSGIFDLASCEQSLPLLQAEWRRSLRFRELPWYAAEKASHGAFSAILIIDIQCNDDDSSRGVWTSLAVGDCCVFHLRGGELASTYPMRRAADFNSRPFLLGTTTQYETIMNMNIEQASDAWEAGDDFLLMTDAIAHWCFMEVEAGNRPWTELYKIGYSDFGLWIDSLRDGRGLRNDDTTILRVRMQ